MRRPTLMETAVETSSDMNAGFDRQPVVAHVEIDRYCDGCGYNLRTQPVRAEPRTAVLMCRCPECGQFTPARDAVTAGRVWLRRLGTFLALIWVPTVLSVGLGLGAAQVGVVVGTLDVLTTFQRVTVNTPAPTSGPTTSPSATRQIPLPPGALNDFAGFGNVTVTITGGGGNSGGQVARYRPVPRTDIEEYRPFIVGMHVLSCALGFLLLLLAVVVMPHWRRWGYLILAVSMPVAAGLIVWVGLHYDMPELTDWSQPYLLGLSAAHLAGCLAAVLVGRPTARMLATLILPPRIRQVVAYLWLADGKTPPAVAASGQITPRGMVS